MKKYIIQTIQVLLLLAHILVGMCFLVVCCCFCLSFIYLKLQKAKLEALNAFGNCALDSMVFKKVDFHVKLEGATPQCDGTLKRKNPECNDPRNVVQTKRPATEKRHQAKAAVKTNAPLKVTKSSGNVSLTSAEASRTKTVQRPHSSLVSFRRMTRIERARLEALESFGNQGLDAVWDSCSKIRSKTLDKKENEGKKEKEEGDDAVQITEGGTDDEEAKREEGQVEVVKSSDARGENYTDKKSSYQPAKEEVDSEEAESIGQKCCRGTPEQGKTGWTRQISRTVQEAASKSGRPFLQHPGHKFCGPRSTAVNK